jgi:hypothetical protein
MDFTGGQDQAFHLPGEAIQSPLASAIPSIRLIGVIGG